jgi:predicted RNA-binding protein with PIN domain
MLLIIDGYNLIRRVPLLARAESLSLEAGRSRLFEHLARYKAKTGHRILVVFDGAPGGESSRGIEARYHTPADNLIVARAGPGSLVVTSDREVASRAQAKGALACSSEEFGARLFPPPGVRPDEADHEDQERPKKGNPRRLGRKAREAARERERLRRILERGR